MFLDLLEHETVSDSGIRWAICKSAPHTSSPPLSFYRPEHHVQVIGLWNVSTTMLWPLYGQHDWVSRHQKGKPVWILLKQEMMGGSSISWTICKSSAPHSGQIPTPVLHHSNFTGRMLFLTPNQQCQSTVSTNKMWQNCLPLKNCFCFLWVVSSLLGCWVSFKSLTGWCFLTRAGTYSFLHA